ncbi:MAG TPA: FAD/NAD(P)-binding protein [Pseudomonadales bacterium]|nr:FAD/NAD(P)-binding protein [Pseudomonadales bacterium]
MPDASSTPTTIAIIGAGCTGALLAINLLKLPQNRHKKILLIDKFARMGRGLAYRTWDDNHVLNVPAGNMSALPDDPQHFVNFCQTIDPAFSAGSFVSRRLYGDYLEHTLAAAALHDTARLQRIAHEAIAVVPDAGNGAGVRIALDGAEAVVADAVVLALGHLPPLDRIPALQACAGAFYVNNPWDARAYDDLRMDDSVLLVGTGHTAVDVLFTLTNLTDQRKVYLVSRRGLLSHPHRPQTHAPALREFPAYLDTVPATARHYFRAVREQVQREAARGVDWRDIIAPLRPHTPAIWQRLPIAERSRFLRHAWTYWDIHRHRLSPSAYVRLQDMIARGQVEIIAGRIQEAVQVDDGVSVGIRARHSEKILQRRVKKIISCTGPNYDIARTEHRLFRQLLRDGLIRQDALKIGLDVNADYAVVSANAEPSTAIFYVGPMLRAQYLEAIGVPELRVHANRLARQLSGV